MAEYRRLLKLLIVLVVNVILVSAGNIKPKSVNHHDNNRYSDCQMLKDAGYNETGIYTLWYSVNTTQVSAQTECQMVGDNAYTVIQRRMDGTVNFNMGFYLYQIGFGFEQSDFWLGLNNIYYLTQTGNTVLTIDMQDWYGNLKTARYNYFKVLDAVNYVLSIGGFQSRDVADDLSFNNGFPFATFDKPDRNNCATNQKSGWWFNYCSYALPNGVYYVGGPYQPSAGYYDGIYWKDWLGYGYSLKFFSMRVSHS